MASPIFRTPRRRASALAVCPATTFSFEMNDSAESARERNLSNLDAESKACFDNRRQICIDHIDAADADPGLCWRLCMQHRCGTCKMCEVLERILDAHNRCSPIAQAYIEWSPEHTRTPLMSYSLKGLERYAQSVIAVAAKQITMDTNLISGEDEAEWNVADEKCGFYLRRFVLDAQIARAAAMNMPHMAPFTETCAWLRSFERAHTTLDVSRGEDVLCTSTAAPRKILDDYRNKKVPPKRLEEKKRGRRPNKLLNF